MTVGLHVADYERLDGSKAERRLSSPLDGAEDAALLHRAALVGRLGQAFSGLAPQKFELSHLAVLWTDFAALRCVISPRADL
jgi:hypothetical protein